jgi:hypothetical protein
LRWEGKVVEKALFDRELGLISATKTWSSIHPGHLSDTDRKEALKEGQ